MSVDEEIKINLEGFDAKAGFGTFLKGVVEDLIQLSPSGSLLRASFTKSDTTTNGSIKILSAEQEFSGSAQGANSREVAVRIAQDIQLQLDQWKRKRKKALADLAKPSAVVLPIPGKTQS